MSSHCQCPSHFEKYFAYGWWTITLHHRMLLPTAPGKTFSRNPSNKKQIIYQLKQSPSRYNPQTSLALSSVATNLCGMLSVSWRNNILISVHNQHLKWPLTVWTILLDPNKSSQPWVYTELFHDSDLLATTIPKNIWVSHRHQESHQRADKTFCV